MLRQVGSSGNFLTANISLYALWPMKLKSQELHEIHAIYFFKGVALREKTRRRTKGTWHVDIFMVVWKVTVCW